MVTRMANHWRSLLGPTLLLLSTHCGSVDDPGETVDSTTSETLCAATDPLISEVLSLPRPVAGTDQKWHLNYELLLQNPGDTPVRIVRIVVTDPEQHAVLSSYEGDDLGALIEVDGETDGTVLEPGGAAAAFIDLTGPLGTRRLRSAPPQRLGHRITTERIGVKREVTGPTTPVASERARVIAPPLHGSGIGVMGCCDGTHRFILAEDADLFYAQRFATDFLQVKGASTYRGDPSNNENYYIFGDDVLAVASGTIVDARDGAVENVPTEPLPPADIESAPGNYIVQALDTGEYALYAHLRQNSVLVHVGERVGRGSVLGRVGNTGNSDEPHLHFHLMDRPSPLVSDGLPYRFDRFRLEATVDVNADEIELVPVAPPNRRHGLLPLTGDIVTFQ